MYKLGGGYEKWAVCVQAVGHHDQLEPSVVLKQHSPDWAPMDLYIKIKHIYMLFCNLDLKCSPCGQNHEVKRILTY